MVAGDDPVSADLPNDAPNPRTGAPSRHPTPQIQRLAWLVGSGTLAFIVSAVTEIPERLLKRSKARRDVLGGSDGGEAPAGTEALGTAVAPASTRAATPARATAAKALPPPPKPDPEYVQAPHKRRKKVPVWAMMTLSILPLWAFMYARSLTPGAVVVRGPLGVGAKAYTGSCATCHGGGGAGGSGRELNDGEVLKTFPHIEDQLNMVYTGSRAFQTVGLPFYGDASRKHLNYNGVYMPQWGEKSGGELTDAEILGVVCHERYDLGGADPAGAQYAAEYDKWCSEDSPIYAGLEDGSVTFENVAAKFPGVLEVGVKPRAATPAGG